MNSVPPLYDISSLPTQTVYEFEEFYWTTFGPQLAKDRSYWPESTVRENVLKHVGGVYLHRDVNLAFITWLAARALFTNVPIQTGVREPFMAVPAGKSAFGYTPDLWPRPELFAAPSTLRQQHLIDTTAKERDVPEEAVEPLRRLVLAAYRLVPADSVATAGLFLDWLTVADDAHIEAALSKVDSPEWMEAPPAHVVMPHIKGERGIVV